MITTKELIPGRGCPLCCGIRAACGAIILLMQVQLPVHYFPFDIAGDYGLYHRTMAGWLSGKERLVLDATIAAGELDKESGPKRLVMWPFDRSESKGRLMSVAIKRLAGEVLLLGFRSASHWQEAGAPGAETWDARQNVRGLGVEFLARKDGSDTNEGWGHRALLDFNALKGDFPEGLPPIKGDFPK
jgi:hypothetical protein